MAAPTSATPLVSIGPADRPARFRLLAVWLAAIALTAVFWLPLWEGGGLVGSDIYAYFLPQKAFLAEQLRAGTLPLWNNRVGWGYPQLAESQTGVFYPLHLPLYAWLDLNSAYNASLIGHYVLAFGFTWMYARQMGLSSFGAGLAALVFTYGWFPPRVCLEWAIIGGAWFPLALWCAERFLQTGWWRYAIGLAFVLALQMLAGHFTLAFVTQLTLLGYVPLRLRLALRESALLSQAPITSTPSMSAENSLSSRGGNTPIRQCVVVGLAIVAGFLLAAVQLVPTWELKQQSQRETVNAEHDPGYGYIPVAYLTQVAAPWFWYADEQAFAATIWPGGSRTNRVEAHLYFGFVPFLLGAGGMWALRRRFDRWLLVWLLLGGLAAFYATGALVPLTRHLPGFSFFEGTGRFGIVTTLAAGLWAGRGFDLLCWRRGPTMRAMLVFGIFATTVGDLWIVSREVTYAFLVQTPPIQRLQSSPLRRRLAEFPEPVRLFSEGKNVPSLLGVGTLPVYLGLGPAAYFDPARKIPGEFDFKVPPVPEQIAWLRRSGVTHLLSFVPLDPERWPVRGDWAGMDPFLNQALARGNKPAFLYRLVGSRDRVAWEEPAVGSTAKIVEYLPARVTIETVAKRDGRLILTDLSYPGWELSMDGEHQEPKSVEGIYRGIELPAGSHQVVWTYRPASLYWGGATSLATLLVLLTVAHIRFWHPHWFEFRTRTATTS